MQSGAVLRPLACFRQHLVVASPTPPLKYGILYVIIPSISRGQIHQGEVGNVRMSYGTNPRMYSTRLQLRLPHRQRPQPNQVPPGTRQRKGAPGLRKRSEIPQLTALTSRWVDSQDGCHRFFHLFEAYRITFAIPQIVRFFLRHIRFPSDNIPLIGKSEFWDQISFHLHNRAL